MIDIHETRKKGVQGVEVGDTFRATRTFTEADVVRFGEIIRDDNPVHFNEAFADVKGLNGRICHGLLVAGMATEIGGQLGWLASEMLFKFRKPVYPGDCIECRLTITALMGDGRVSGEAVYLNQNGVTVLEAVVKGIAAGEAEKAILCQIVAQPDRGRTGAA
ncbi:MAG: MaoC family dehydratase [Deltaproteobacteria bacterium]|nr:MaoC family dehydratase [Deltaproteobacteria bacterium]